MYALGRAFMEWLVDCTVMSIMTPTDTMTMVIAHTDWSHCDQSAQFVAWAKLGRKEATKSLKNQWAVKIILEIT